MDARQAYRDRPLVEFLSAVAAPTPAPGGGAAAATSVALAAGLVAMAAGYPGGVPDEVLERARQVQSRALELAEEDAAAYAEVLAARSSGDAAREAAAWERAVAVPLEIAGCGARTAVDAATVAEHARAALRGDAFTAVVLAEAGVRAAVRLVELNVAASSGDGPSLARARRLALDASAAVHRVDW